MLGFCKDMKNNYTKQNNKRKKNCVGTRKDKGLR